jgi:Uma2 family endonuclease
MPTKILRNKTAEFGIKPSTKPILWADFERKYLSREDGFKYEWLNGIVEKTPRSMHQSQLFIQHFLNRFILTMALQCGEDLGSFTAEADAFFNMQHRKPDLAYFTHEELRRMRTGEKIVPMFIVEIISPSDNINRVTQKLADYRAAGVLVVWHIFPQLEEVHVYKGENMTICKTQTLCTAHEVIKGFAFSVNDLFNF